MQKIINRIIRRLTLHVSIFASLLSFSIALDSILPISQMLSSFSQWLASITSSSKDLGNSSSIDINWIQVIISALGASVVAAVITLNSGSENDE